MSQASSAEPSFGLSAAQLDALRPYVVDLQDGRFSSAAKMNTTAEDVDAIFDTHLPAFIAARGGTSVPVMFWAHGGLVSEGSALQAANQHVQWWLGNGVYPIFFVWHTDLWSTLGDLVANHVAAAAAARPADAPAFRLSDITDAAIEMAVRGLGGPAVWGEMKVNAERASAAGGGGAYVAGAAKAFVAANTGAVTLHAAGHSAGAIFLSYFVPAVIEQGVVEFDSLALLAPALRTHVFESTLEPRIGAGIKSAAMFTMTETLERSDNCFGLYRKSLLYLIRGGLEPERNANILGLQECVLADQVLSRLFPTAPGGGDAEAVWSQTSTGALDSRSMATSHGAFDNDTATMDSVARRVVGSDNVVSFATSSNLAVLAAAAKVHAPQTMRTPTAVRIQTAAEEKNSRGVGVKKDSYS